MKVTSFVIALLVLFAVTLRATADECIKTAKCTCKTSGGSVVDLNPLTKGPNPRFTATVTKTGYIYYFSPCVPLVQPGCNSNIAKSLSICQYIPPPAGQAAQYYDAGDDNTEVFAGDPALGTLTVSYTGTGSLLMRTSHVKVICSEESRLDFVSEKPQGTYLFNLYTPIICPSSPASEPVLSTGSILVITFFVLFIIYWIAGFMFMKFVRRAEGVEAIPHYEFWKGLPLLIRDGVAFAAWGCKGESTYQKI